MVYGDRKIKHTVIKQRGKFIISLGETAHEWSRVGGGKQLLAGCARNTDKIRKCSVPPFYILGQRSCFCVLSL